MTGRRGHFDAGHGIPDHTVVHHGRWYSNTLDPQDTHESGFHAGTWQSALDRLSGNLDEESSWRDPGDIMNAEVHSYAVPNNLIDQKMWNDPMTRRPSAELTPVDEAPEDVLKQKVLPYENEYEDKGSTSFLIHPDLVFSGRIKHLGRQIIASLYIPEDDSDDEPELAWHPNAKKFDMNNLEKD